MNYFIKELTLPEKILKTYKISDPDNPTEDIKILKNLSKVNIFIGANNSGKSRFMRALSFQTQYTFLPSDNDTKKIKELLIDFVTKFIKSSLCTCNLFSRRKEDPSLQSIVSRRK